MKQLNVMSLAWKIIKNSKIINKFSYALSLAWKILKQSKIIISDNIIKIKSKLLKSMKIYIAKNEGKVDIIKRKN